MRRALAASLTLLALTAPPIPPSFASPDLYVSGWGGSELRAFSVGSRGRLVPLPGGPYPAGARPEGLVISPEGRRLYAANSFGDSISAFRVIGGGGLGPLTGSPFTAGRGPVALALSPDGRRLAVSEFEAGAIGWFAVSAAGGLNPVGGSVAVGAEPSGVAIAPDGGVVYVSSSSGTVSAFRAGRGPLEELAGSPWPTGVVSRGIAIAADGNTLYVANRDSDDISGFAVGAHGRLRALSDSPFPAGDGPSGIALHGRRLFASAIHSDSVGAYRIDRSGSLRGRRDRPSGGERPDGLALTPDGRRLYVSNFGSDSISGFDVGRDGRLRALPGSPYPAGVSAPAFQSLAVTPDQGPRARFRAAVRPAGERSRFDGSASTDGEGPVERFDWRFGDGTRLRDGGPRPRHRYARPGRYRVSLVVTDRSGCSREVVFTGQVVTCNGGRGARAVRGVRVP